jgi:hypothetical protein
MRQLNQDDTDDDASFQGLTDDESYGASDF